MTGLGAEMVVPDTTDPTGRLICVAPAPSIDRYYWLPDLQVGSIQRPSRVAIQAGGKGLHVAQVATLLGTSVVLVGILGGNTGRWIEARARDFTSRSHWAWSDSETRQCVCVYDVHSGALTEFYEPVQAIGPPVWDDLEALFEVELSRVPEADGSLRDPLVVVSGRVPPGAPASGIAHLVEMAGRQSLRTLVDSDGAGLASCLRAGPWLVKINAIEAQSLLGMSVDNAQDAVAAARRLRHLGAGGAVITLGGTGAVYSGPDWSGLLVSGPIVSRPLPVGSGDVFLAALASQLVAGHEMRDSLVTASAAATANAETLVAGEISVARVSALRAQTHVTDLG